MPHDAAERSPAPFHTSAAAAFRPPYKDRNWALVGLLLAALLILLAGFLVR